MAFLGITDLTDYVSFVEENETADIPLYIAIFMEVNPQITGYSVIQGALNHIPAFVIALSPDCSIDAVSSYFLKKTGYSKEEVEHKYINSITTDSFECIKGNCDLKVALLEKRDAEITFINKEGKPVDYLCSLSPLNDENGKLKHLILVGQDITPLKQAEAELKSIISENDKIKETIPGILFMYDRQKESTTYLNSRVFQYLPESDHNLPHDQVFEKLIHPEDMSIIQKQETDWDTNPKKEKVAVTVSLHHRKLGYKWHSVLERRWNTDEARITSTTLGVVLDIHEQTV